MAMLETLAARMKESAPVKWLFAGDSITHGALHTFGYRDYTEHFCERIRFELGRVRDCVIKTAVSGWWISTLENDLDWSLLQHKPDVVFMKFGMNDCTSGDAGLSAFVTSYEKVLERIRKETHAIVILQTITGTQGLDAIRHASVKNYSQAVRTLAEKWDLPLIDHDADWQKTADRNALAYWLSDPIHPNEYGHRAMAHLVFRTLNMWDSNSYTCRLMVP